ncbi:methylated-DNA--[protein]-cysteine S-methyltransferase [Thermincola ferriacetica]
MRNSTVNCQYVIFNTPLGYMGAVATVQGLATVVLPQVNSERVWAALAREFPFLERQGSGWPDTVNGLLDKFVVLAGEYFAGWRIDFSSLQLDLSWATDFQLRVYSAAREIPYGQTRSYRDIACAIGKPKGYRAVGGALKRNRLPLVIPCHRVIACNGGLGGFTGASLGIKTALLTLESSR